MKRTSILTLFVVFAFSNIIHVEKIRAQDLQSFEQFSDFYMKFYNDNNFQKSRIILPLKGIIKTWKEDIIKEESWKNKKITVTPKDVFLKKYDNLKTSMINKDSIIIEKYWIEN